MVSSRGEYARNILRQDIYKHLESNPEATFDEALAAVRPNEVPANYMEYYEDMYNEAKTALANGEDLTLAIYTRPQQTATGRNIYGEDDFTLDTVEIEAGARRGQGVDLGEEKNMEDPMTLPEGEDRGDQVFDAYDDPIEFRIVEDYELRNAAERALVQSGEYQYIEAANLATEEMIDAAFGGAGAGLLLMSFTPGYGSWFDWFAAGPGEEPTDYAAALPGAANVYSQIQANQRRDEKARLQAERDEINERISPLKGQTCFVRVNGQWYSGTVDDTTILQNYRGITANVGTVTIGFDTVGSRKGQQTLWVPLDDNTLFRVDDGTWTPPGTVAFWEPGTDPTKEYVTNNTHIEDHLREQIFAEGQWRTLQTVRPAPGYPNNKTLVFTDGTTFVLKGTRNVSVRLYGETGGADDDDPPTDDDDPPTDDDGPPTDDTPVPETVPDTKQPNKDSQNVMSYLKREHNEVYTIWKNPAYTGTDWNRVERIFGGVVPFLSYNSEGHPILTNDQELDHHGHSEFNMVHVSSLELQEQAAGQVDNTNTADIQQTNVAADPVNET